MLVSLLAALGPTTGVTQMVLVIMTMGGGGGGGGERRLAPPVPSAPCFCQFPTGEEEKSLILLPQAGRNSLLLHILSVICD